APTGLGKPALHQHPRGPAEAFVAAKLGVHETARPEELVVLHELEAYAEGHAGKALAARLAFGFVHERSGDALPPVLRIDRDAADVERAVLLFPQHCAGHDILALQDPAAAAREPAGAAGDRICRGGSPAESGRRSRPRPGSRAAPSPARRESGEWS